MNARKNILYIVIIFVSVVIDQVVKYLCSLYIKPIGSVSIIDNIIGLRYCENTGAAFSILEGKTWFFIILTTLLVLVFGTYLFAGKIMTTAAAISVSFIVAGGLGNLIDRCLHGYVIDMFEFLFIDFAIFNVADVFVTCGAVVFILCYAFSRREVIEWNLFRSRKTPEDD